MDQAVQCRALPEAEGEIPTLEMPVSCTATAGQAHTPFGLPPASEGVTGTVRLCRQRKCFARNALGLTFPGSSVDCALPPGCEAPGRQLWEPLAFALFLEERVP